MRPSLTMLAEQLEERGQNQLIAPLFSKSDAEIALLLTQINPWSVKQVQEQLLSWQNKGVIACELQQTPPLKNLAPLEKASDFSQSALLLLAGGDGSRLGASVPKGCIPVGRKSLFQWHCEKIKQTSMPLLVLTSPSSHRTIQQFFQEHDFFGLSRVYFIPQPTLPLLDSSGKWFYNNQGLIQEGPDGNGSFLKVALPLFFQWQQEGIRNLHVLAIDNPLAPLLDKDPSIEASALATPVSHPLEPMGRWVSLDKCYGITEYEELPVAMRETHLLANGGAYTFDLRVLCSLHERSLPLHWAYRKEAWKGEYWITDYIPFLKRLKIFYAPREHCYAPIKDLLSISIAEKLLYSL